MRIDVTWPKVFAFAMLSGFVSGFVRAATLAWLQ